MGRLVFENDSTPEEARIQSLEDECAYLQQMYDDSQRKLSALQAEIEKLRAALEEKDKIINEKIKQQMFCAGCLKPLKGA